MRTSRPTIRLATLLLFMLLANGVSAPAHALMCGAHSVSVTAEKVGAFSDAACRTFYVDPTLSTPSTIQPQGNVPPAGNLSDVFALHSRPGAGTIIYLDFDGFTWGPGTWWDTTYPTVAASLEGRVSTGFDRDGDPTTFTAAERQDITQIWAGMAEDFAVFDIDVTTEVPTGTALDTFKRSGSYGLILSDTDLQVACGCGGVAYVGVVNNAASPEKRPALIHTKFNGSVTQNWDIEEIAAHEIGHNFGLVHDGTTTTEYYAGGANWAPIMGGGRGAGIVTWSAGGYPDSMTRGTQYSTDDFATIAQYSSLIPDVVGDTIDTATDGSLDGSSVAINGLINSAADKDVYKVVVPPGSTGSWTINVNSVSPQPNLDPELVLMDAAGTPIGTSNPLVASGRQFGAIQVGLDASVTFAATPGTYYVSIDGVGQGSLSAGTGYSDYGSVGNYQLEIKTQTPAITNSSTLVGGPGTPIVISGYNLAQIRAVRVAGADVSRFTLTAVGQILTSVPTGAGIGPIEVTDSRGVTYASGTIFNARYAPAVPVIENVSNRSPAVAEVVTLTGSNIGATKSLTIGGQSTEFTAIDPSTIQFIVKTTARSGSITASSDGGSATDSTGFAPKAAPQIDSIAPLAADPGQTITVTGANFNAVTAVVWNGNSIPFSRKSDRVITFAAGAVPGMDNVTLDGTWGIAKTADKLTVNSFVPVITALSRVSGPVGTMVRVTGQHFADVTSLTLNGKAASFKILSNNEIEFNVPAGATSGVVVVTSVFGSASSASAFAVLPSAPVVTAVTPKAAKAGATVTISGRNFVGTISVSIGGAKALKVVRLSSTKIRVVIPKTAKTGFVVVASIGGTAKSSAKFVLQR